MINNCKLKLTIIIFVALFLLSVSYSFASQETLDSLKTKEDEILMLLSQKNLNDKIKANEALVKKDINQKTLAYKEDFSKRILRRKNLRKQLSLRKNNFKQGKTLEAPIIVASNKIIDVDKEKINKDLNSYIKKANNILADVKKDNSKKVINKEYFTISTDYFDDEEADEGASYVYVTDDVSLHTLPSLSSKLIYLVKANTRLKLDKNHGAWYRVKSADNKYGWILGDMINFSDPNSYSTIKNKGKTF